MVPFTYLGQRIFRLSHSREVCHSIHRGHSCASCHAGKLDNKFHGQPTLLRNFRWFWIQITHSVFRHFDAIFPFPGAWLRLGLMTSTKSISTPGNPWPDWSTWGTYLSNWRKLGCICHGDEYLNGLTVNFLFWVHLLHSYGQWCKFASLKASSYKKCQSSIVIEMCWGRSGVLPDRRKPGMALMFPGLWGAVTRDL